MAWPSQSNTQYAIDPRGENTLLESNANTKIHDVEYNYDDFEDYEPLGTPPWDSGEDNRGERGYTYQDRNQAKLTRYRQEGGTGSGEVDNERTNERVGDKEEGGAGGGLEQHRRGGRGGGKGMVFNRGGGGGGGGRGRRGTGGQRGRGGGGGRGPRILGGEVEPPIKEVHYTPNEVHTVHYSRSANKKIKLMKKLTNPTIESLRSAALKSQESPTTLKQKYRVCVKQAEEIKPKNVFKKSITFLLESRNYQITIVATDSPTSLQNFGKKAQQFKRSHPEWSFNQTMVAIFLQRLDSTEEKEIKCFCLDIPAFLHTFNDPDFLARYINNVADILSHSWNQVNSRSSKANVRSENEIPIFLDFRSTGLIKPSMHHLALAGTTYNHTLMTQNDPTDVICEPENIYFQLRYQHSNNTIKAGMATLSKEEWIDFISNPQFREFYNEVWDFLPLTEEYSQDRMEYFSTLEQEGIILLNAQAVDYHGSQGAEPEEAGSPEKEEDVDEPVAKRIKLEEGLVNNG